MGSLSEFELICQKFTKPINISQVLLDLKFIWLVKKIVKKYMILSKEKAS